MFPFTFLFLLIPIKLASLLIATRGTISGAIKPSRVSLILWSLPPLISFIIAFTNGAFLSALPLLLAALGPLFILLVTYLSHQTHWKAYPMDYVSGLFSFITIIIWVLTADAVLAVIFAIIADLFASLPTFIKSWNHPETESVWIYILSAIGNGIGLLTLHRWNMTTAGFSVYLIILSIAISFIIIHRPLAKSIRK